ncbi:MAG: hypothetical protein OIF36_00710 [Alphaproteobacteria bacterium]|nr:hypothetical protein [Alphaproteobacteria bacterium]
MKKIITLIFLILLTPHATAKSYDKNSWEFNGKIISIKSLYTEWLSSDNLEQVIKNTNIKDIEKLSKTPGVFLGEHNLQVKSLCSQDFCKDVGITRNLYITTKQEAKIRNDGFDLEADYYEVIKDISNKKAKQLSPNFKGEILSSKLLKITKHTGGSIGNLVTYGIYSLILSDNIKKVSPLVLFSGEE